MFLNALRDTLKLSNIKIPRLNAWQEVALLGVMFMQLSWILPWYHSLTPTTRSLSPLRVLAILGMMLIVTALLARALTYLAIKENISRYVLFIEFVIGAAICTWQLLFTGATNTIKHPGGGLFMMIADLESLLPVEFITLLAVFLVWRSGIFLGNQGIGTHWVIRQFRIGILMLAVFMVATLLGDYQLPTYAVYLFLFSSLLAMGAARIATQNRLRGGVIGPFDINWLGGMVLAALIVVMFAAGVGILMEGPVGQWILLGVEIVIVAIVLVFVGPFLLAPFLLGLIAGKILDIAPAEEIVDPIQNLEKSIDDIMEVVLEVEPAQFDTTWLMSYIKPVLAVIVLVMVTLTLIRTIKIVRRRRGRYQEGFFTYESMSLLDAMRAAWRERGLKFRERLNAARLRYADRLKAAARIRRVYASLLDLSHDLGVERPVANTPLEFLPKLISIYPFYEDELRLITHAYIRVRYGQLPEHEDQVLVVEEAWERVKVFGEIQLKEYRRKAKLAAHEMRIDRRV
jgi:hypothetical protein